MLAMYPSLSGASLRNVTELCAENKAIDQEMGAKARGCLFLPAAATRHYFPTADQSFPRDAPTFFGSSAVARTCLTFAGFARRRCKRGTSVPLEDFSPLG